MKNKKYEVKVYPMHIYKEITFEVEATNPQEAEHKVYQEALELDQSDLRIFDTHIELDNAVLISENS